MILSSREISVNAIKIEMKHFGGGQLKHFCHKWSKFNDKFITEISSNFPSKSDFNLYRRSKKEHTITLAEIQTLQQKRLIILIIRENSAVILFLGFY